MTIAALMQTLGLDTDKANSEHMALCDKLCREIVRASPDGSPAGVLESLRQIIAERNALRRASEELNSTNAQLVTWMLFSGQRGES